jgi:hypothetical protein
VIDGTTGGTADAAVANLCSGTYLAVAGGNANLTFDFVVQRQMHITWNAVITDPTPVNANTFARLSGTTTFFSLGGSRSTSFSGVLPAGGYTVSIEAGEFIRLLRQVDRTAGDSITAHLHLTIDVTP